MTEWKSHEDYLASDSKALTMPSNDNKSGQTKLKLVGSDGVQEFYIPADIDKNKFTGLLHKPTGTLLLNIDGVDHETMINSPDTPDMFRNKDEVMIFGPEVLKEITDGGESISNEIR